MAFLTILLELEQASFLFNRIVGLDRLFNLLKAKAFDFFANFLQGIAGNFDKLPLFQRLGRGLIGVRLAFFFDNCQKLL